MQCAKQNYYTLGISSKAQRDVIEEAIRDHIAFS